MWLERLAIPAATEGFDQLNGSDEPLAGEFGVGALGLQGLAARVHNFKIAHNSGAIPIRGQIRGAAGVGDGALLRLGLLVEIVNARETVFHFTESDKHPLAI